MGYYLVGQYYGCSTLTRWTQGEGGKPVKSKPAAPASPVGYQCTFDPKPTRPIMCITYPLSLCSKTDTWI